MIIMKLQTLDETNMLHNLHCQLNFHFLIFCMKDFGLSHFFIVSGKSDHVFGAMEDMVFVPYLTELGFLL